MRRTQSIVRFEHAHYAMLPVRAEQAGDLKLMGEAASIAADRGPAFSVVEHDEAGNVAAVLACAGLAETAPHHASAWAAFAEGLRPAQWSPIVHAIRGVLDGCGYVRVDMYVRADWPQARGFAEALGFTEKAVLYVRESE